MTKAYTKTNHVNYYPAETDPDVAIAEILKEHGERPEGVPHHAHSFAVIHGWKVGSEKQEVLPIK